MAEQEQPIVNKVAKSGLLTIDLATFKPEGEITDLDIANQLFQGMILREKDFRTFVKEHNWEQYAGKHVGIYCSVDAIIPTWAFMLLVTKLTPVARSVMYGNREEVNRRLYTETLRAQNWQDYQDARVVVKGCGDDSVPVAAYTELTTLLQQHGAKTIMYGEPCSTVPVYKKPR